MGKTVRAHQPLYFLPFPESSGDLRSEARGSEHLSEFASLRNLRRRPRGRFGQADHPLSCVAVAPAIASKVFVYLGAGMCQPAPVDIK
jgi:hypothetical protein